MKNIGQVSQDFLDTVADAVKDLSDQIDEIKHTRKEQNEGDGGDQNGGDQNG